MTAGVPSCGTSAGLVRHSVHERAGQVPSERHVSYRRPTRCRISALGQAPWLAAAGHSQSGSSVALSVMARFALGRTSHRCLCIVAFNILACFLWYWHMCKHDVRKRSRFAMSRLRLLYEVAVLNYGSTAQSAPLNVSIEGENGNQRKSANLDTFHLDVENISPPGFLKIKIRAKPPLLTGPLVTF